MYKQIPCLLRMPSDNTQNSRDFPDLWYRLTFLLGCNCLPDVSDNAFYKYLPCSLTVKISSNCYTLKYGIYSHLNQSSWAMVTHI